MKKLISLALVLCSLFSGILAPPAQAQSVDDYFSVLLMGMDEGAEEALVETQYGRTDAMMLVSFNKKNGQLHMMNVERDYRTDALSSGPNKLCVVCLMEGPQRSLDAVNELFALSVPYYALIAPADMEAIVDALGGIDINILETDLYIHLDDGRGGGSNPKKAFKQAGQQIIHGAQARALVRTRVKPDGEYETDEVRNERQQRTLMAMIKKALSGGKSEMVSFALAAIQHVQTNANVLDLLALAEPLLFGELQSPDFTRTPMTGSSLKKVGIQRLVVLDDPAEECREVRAFLYPEVYGELSETEGE